MHRERKISLGEKVKAYTTKVDANPSIGLPRVKKRWNETKRELEVVNDEKNDAYVILDSGRFVTVEMANLIHQIGECNDRTQLNIIKQHLAEWSANLGYFSRIGSFPANRRDSAIYVQWLALPSTIIACSTYYDTNTSLFGIAMFLFVCFSWASASRSMNRHNRSDKRTKIDVCRQLQRAVDIRIENLDAARQRRLFHEEKAVKDLEEVITTDCSPTA